jgi:hypothetical protein
MTNKQPDPVDINALAMEACDMWQEHLTNLANDSAAREELTKFLEPQRRLFADWANMMRQGGRNDSSRAKEETAANSDIPPEPAPTADAPAEAAAAADPAPAAPSGTAAHGDDPLRVAQLALRLAELERHIAQLESRLSLAAK